MIKQVLVVRKDLNMRKGKIAAQCAHASMKVFFDKKYINKKSVFDNLMMITINDEEREWIEGSFTKIVVYVNSEQELIDVYNKAKINNLLCSLVEDNGLTEFHGIKTPTVVAIGPAKSQKIDEITKNLPLL